MATRCIRCGGDGHIFADCPFCRDTESHEHDNLGQGACIACHNSGLLEDVCPKCQGRGVTFAEGTSAG